MVHLVWSETGLQLAVRNWKTDMYSRVVTSARSKRDGEGGVSRQKGRMR